MTGSTFRLSAKLKTRSAILLTLSGFWLASCGGGDGDTGGTGFDGKDPELISGTVIGSPMAGIQVCVDSDRNLHCDPHEVRTQTDAQGAFALALQADTPTAQSLVLVLVPASTAMPAHTLAAPLAAPGVVSPLTTLWSLSMLAQGSSAEAAAQSLRERGLLAPGSEPGEHYVATGNRAMMALADAFAPAYASAAARPEGGSALQAAQDAVAAASDILVRYMGSAGVLLPTVSAKTVLSEMPLRLGYDTLCYEKAPSVLRIVTEGFAPVVSKEQYLHASLALLEPGGATPLMETGTRIRGRGNSTWEMAKKPYRLNFDSASSVLGMPSERDWNLLADYADKSLLRNAMALCLGQRMDMPHTPQYRPVELTLNDTYLGVYLITERIEVGENRVPVTELGAGDDDPEAITGGYLLEIDGRLGEDHWFRSWVYDIPITIQSPNAPTEAQLAYISGYFNAMEEAMLTPEMNYADYLDVESLVDYYLVNELLRNVDAFRYSGFMYKERGGKLTFGPIWDFDLAADNALEYVGARIEGWYLKDSHPWLARFFEDPRFVRHVQARWAFLKAQLPYLQSYIDAMAGHYSSSGAQQRNFAAWPVLHTVVPPARLALGSHEAEVGYLKTWLASRAAWMDEAIHTLTPAAATAEPSLAQTGRQ